MISVLISERKSEINYPERVVERVVSLNLKELLPCLSIIEWRKAYIVEWGKSLEQRIITFRPGITSHEWTRKHVVFQGIKPSSPIPLQGELKLPWGETTNQKLHRWQNLNFGLLRARQVLLETVFAFFCRWGCDGSGGQSRAFRQTGVDDPSKSDGWLFLISSSYISE